MLGMKNQSADILRRIQNIRNRNLIEEHVITWVNTRGNSAHTDFLDKKLANAYLINWAESLGYDHPIILG